jgi:hypothetical protein
MMSEMVPGALFGVPEMPDTPPGRMLFLRFLFKTFFCFFAKNAREIIPRAGCKSA